MFFANNRVCKKFGVWGCKNASAEMAEAFFYSPMYLAVRLAVCRLALPEEDKCPIILDDPLVNFDSEREKQAIKLLEEIAKERQVILFSCHCE